ncbi:MAG: hypothetical protein A2096_11890 [Spirochaetes bacterium GWF1_41_5]|nr:MAG: hypothetical protein A2096_11890 [Spirochaetes bacterium GWF1_41_5]HBE02576.1 hypothetical protein [Spirochaetia bacterium]
MLDETGLEAYSPVLVKLLGGPLYSEDRQSWELLITNRHFIEVFFSKLGIGLFIQEADGYAYLCQYSDEELALEQYKIPRLIRRMPLTYEVTLMLVLLRDRLQQFEISRTQEERLVMTRDELREMVTLFFREKADEVKMLGNIDAVIQKTADLGFLRLLSSKQKNLYEVMRIIKSRLPAEELEHIREKLAGFYKTADSGFSSENAQSDEIFPRPAETE